MPLRAMILDIMLKLKEDFGISFLYITHDLLQVRIVLRAIQLIRRSA